MKIFMRISGIFIVLFLIQAGILAQVPQGFNFQGVATDASGLPISNQEIVVQISIIEETDTGDVVYSETHLVTTNLTGLFQLIIGEGVAQEGPGFSGIDWGLTNYYVGVAVDIENSGEFESLGATKLLSVPYALLAHNVVNGGDSGEIPMEILLDASVDTAFQVKISGNEGDVNNSAIIGEATTFGTNIGVEGKAISQSGSEATQIGTYGEVGGEGTGTHIALFGSAINDEGTGGRRYGLYGQARSVGRENIGGFGIGLGAGDGEIVLRGDEFANDGDFNVGGFNAGLIGFARQNLNGNIGVRGYVYGDTGARSNRALQAEARTEADGVNIGVQALVSGSNSENIGIEVDVYDEDDVKNVGTVINTGGSTASNIGLIVNADTAAILSGHFTVNGNADVSGTITTTALTETSDLRIKKNIQSLNNSLNNTLQLRGVSYNWADETKGSGLQIGVIAQEVEEIYPEFVYTDDKGMKSVNYSQMVAVLIEAVKELNLKVEALEAENSELRAQADEIDTIKFQIDQLTNLITPKNGMESVSADK